jgi:hypothetical protein
MISNRRGPLIDCAVHTKDPCPVFDGTNWHIYGTRSEGNDWRVLHAISSSIEGPYTLEPPVDIAVDSPNACAPGVLYSNGLFHMYMQTEFFKTKGQILYLTSADGRQFDLKGIALDSVPGGQEAGIYDSHPTVVNGRLYMTYSGFQDGKSVQGDIYLATADRHEGPWTRLGKILDHGEVPCHNPKDSDDYEWGLEGAQILQVGNKVLLTSVVFLPTGKRGTRQRAAFFLADDINGPYKFLGLLEPTEGWQGGENGHSCTVMHDGQVRLFYQANSADLGLWRYGVADFNVPSDI